MSWVWVVEQGILKLNKHKIKTIDTYHNQSHWVTRTRKTNTKKLPGTRKSHCFIERGREGCSGCVYASIRSCCRFHLADKGRELLRVLRVIDAHRESLKMSELNTLIWRKFFKLLSLIVLRYSCSNIPQISVCKKMAWKWLSGPFYLPEYLKYEGSQQSAYMFKLCIITFLEKSEIENKSSLLRWDDFCFVLSN